MISKSERERDKAICEAATRQWRQAHHVGEPRAIYRAKYMDLSLLALDRDGMAIFAREADAAAAVNAVNRLPVYIADAEEMERRIRIVEGTAAELRRLAPGVDAEQAAEARVRAEAIEGVLRILRGEP